MFEHIKEDVLEKKFIKEIRHINNRLTKLSTLLFNRYSPKNYSISQLREKSHGNLITIFKLRYRMIMHYKGEVEKLRVELRYVYRRYRKLLIENYRLRKCKDKRHMRRKLNVRSCKTKIITR